MLFQYLAYFNGWVIGCGTLCVTRFEPTRFTCAMYVRRVGSELSLFEQSRSARESVFMMRRLVRIQSKFWWHNPDVLRCTISGV
jgi:hypothetical protein